jgi:hypothetical protein
MYRRGIMSKVTVKVALGGEDNLFEAVDSYDRITCDDIQHAMEYAQVCMNRGLRANVYDSDGQHYGTWSWY